MPAPLIEKHLIPGASHLQEMLSALLLKHGNILARPTEFKTAWTIYARLHFYSEIWGFKLF